MKQQTLSVLMVSLFLAVIGVTSLVYSAYKVVDTKVIPYDITIANRYGFVLDNDALHFGSVKPGMASSVKYIDIINPTGHTVQAEIHVEGDLNQYMLFSERPFNLTAGQEKRLSATFAVPSNTAYGNYSGTVVIIFKKV